MDTSTQLSLIFHTCWMNLSYLTKTFISETGAYKQLQDLVKNLYILVNHKEKCFPIIVVHVQVHGIRQKAYLRLQKPL